MAEMMPRDKFPEGKSAWYWEGSQLVSKDEIQS